MAIPFFFSFLNLSFGQGGIIIDSAKGIKYKIGYTGHIANNNVMSNCKWKRYNLILVLSKSWYVHCSL